VLLKRQKAARGSRTALHKPNLLTEPQKEGG